MATEYNDISAVPLSDGRVQLFAVDTNFQLWSQWQESTNPGSGWTGWTPFAMPPVVGVAEITGSPLLGGGTQLWAIDTDRNTWSCWKTGDSNSAWTSWSTF